MHGDEHITEYKEFEEYSGVYGRAVDPSNQTQNSLNDGEETHVGGYTFLWVYDQNVTTGNGFTGSGWYETLSKSPLAVIGYTPSQVEENLRNGTWTNLNVIFSEWQSYANEHPDEFVASTFAKALPDACWR